MKKTVQVGIIGAMQRAHPALTELWLKWTGIPSLAQASFNVIKTTEGPGEMSSEIQLKATSGLYAAWTALGDLFSFPADAPERQQMPMILVSRAPAHRLFWAAMKKREVEVEDSPLEWWWRLHVLRSRGVRAASSRLLQAVFGDEPMFDGAVVRLVNPTLKPMGRRAKEISESMYKTPTHLHVLLRSARAGKHEGFSFPLSVGTFRDTFVSTLVDQAVSRS